MKVIQNNTSGSIQLTPNFFLSEFTDSDKAVRLSIDNTPDPLAVAALYKTAAMLERVRKALGDKVISISSGFRCQKLNQAVGGSPVSDHMRGEAVDFVCRSFGTPLQVSAAIQKSGIPFGQLIFEGTWVHMSLPTREVNGEVLTAKFVSGKKTVYLKGLVA